MPYKDPVAARLASRERVRRYRKRQSIAKKLGPSAVEVTGDPADVLAAWSAATLVVPAGHPNAGQPMTLPPYGVEFLRETRRGARQLAAASTGAPLGDQADEAELATAERLAAGASKPVVDRNTALRPACDGLPGTPWLLAPRRPLDKLDLFRLSQDGGLVFPFRRAHYQPAPDRPCPAPRRRDTRTSRPRPAAMSPRCRTPPLHGAALGAPIGWRTAARRSVALPSKRSTRRSPWP